jgi:hypothetical protein
VEAEIIDVPKARQARKTRKLNLYPSQSRRKKRYLS